MLHRGDNRIQAYSHQEPPIFGLGSSFDEPQDYVCDEFRLNIAQVQNRTFSPN